MPDPPYLVIAADLESKISSGELARGDRLRAIVDLAHDYKVNKNTIVKALNVLRDKNLIESRQGWGTFVSQGLRVMCYFSSLASTTEIRTSWSLNFSRASSTCC